MRKIKIICPKNHNIQWIQDGVTLFEKKLRSLCQLEIKTPKESGFNKILNDTTHFIALDIEGQMFDSKSFSKFLSSRTHTTFVIGPSEGLTQGQKERASHRISLSSMTFTHQQTKVLLLEQIYRALQIERSSPYHK
jgi:23S rRNA (pseudouridine1915-N3)-methyltransferase